MNRNTYRLYASARSPFARRIRLALNRLKVEVEEEFFEVFDYPKKLIAANPLGAVPVLITPEFGPLTDSSTILEFLHDRHGGIWSNHFHAKIRARQSSALAMGLIDMSVRYFQEAKLHEAPSPFWQQDHATAFIDTLKRAQEMPKIGFIFAGELTQGGWDLACALEYASLRLPFLNAQKTATDFSEILQIARENAYFIQTAPKA